MTKLVNNVSISKATFETSKSKVQQRKVRIPRQNALADIRVPVGSSFIMRGPRNVGPTMRPTKGQPKMTPVQDCGMFLSSM